MPDIPQPNKSDNTVAGLIHRIKIGALNPKLLKKEQRLLCVEALYFDSTSPTNMAQFFDVDDRTIRRDLDEIRTRNALTIDPEFALKLMGEFKLFAMIHHGNLMKLARNPSASTSERLQAEYNAYLVLADMITKFQSIGAIPKSPEAFVVLQNAEDASLRDQVKEMVLELDDMIRLETDPQKAGKLLDYKKELSSLPKAQNGPDQT